MSNNYKYTVCVRCATYNHGPFIIDALNGFAMQETDFPVVTVIIDDASTDNTPNKLRQFLADKCDFANENASRQDEDYAVIEQAPLRDHPNHFFVVVYLKENHYSKKKPKNPYAAKWNDNAKYIALCEGDDYWTDPCKLQKQVDFMESHPTCSLSFCAHQELYPDGHLEDVKRYARDVDACPVEDIIVGGGGYMATCSMLYVRTLRDNYPDWAINTPVGDLPLMLVLAFRGDVGFISTNMCVYRRSASGSWSYRLARNRSMQKNHYKGTLKMWRGFDDWTNKSYHHIIKDILREARINYLRLTFLYYIKYQFKRK